MNRGWEPVTSSGGLEADVAVSASGTTTAVPKVHEMVIIHRFFRRELVAVPLLVRGTTAGDTDRARVVGDHLQFVLDSLRVHHTGEDELLWPKLLERAGPSLELVHTMESQHSRVEVYLEQAEPALSGWMAEPSVEARERLAAIVDDLRVALVEHLDLEEREILPVVERHISVEEWAALAEHGKNATPRKQLPLAFGAMLEDTNDQERAELLASVPAPVRFFLRTAGARQYRRYISRVRGE